MAIFCPTGVVCKESRQKISALTFLLNKRMKTDFSDFFFRCRKSDKEVIVAFHDYSTITRVKYALFWPHFRLFSMVIMLELCQSFSSMYYVACRWTPHFCLKLCLQPGGPESWIQVALIRPFIDYFAFGAVGCCSSSISPILILSVLARPANLI